MVENGLKILVLAGGESTERQVSLTSAKSVTKTLMDAGHEVRVIDTVSGNFLEYNRGNFVGIELPPDTDLSLKPAAVASMLSTAAPARMVCFRRYWKSWVFHIPVHHRPHRRLP